MSDVNDDVLPDSPWPALNLTNHERSDNSSGSPQPTSYADPEFHKGVTDGRVGVMPRNIRAGLELMASRRHATELQVVEQELATATNEYDILTKRHEQFSAQAGALQLPFDEIHRHRQGNLSSYSVLMGIVYCAVAVIFWIADLPLSLLAADGLGIRTQYAVLSDVSQIALKWQTLWEPIAFAIGIAALGLFFKFVADFFFKARFRDHAVMKATSVLLVIGIVALIVANLYCLALLRTDVRVLQEAQRRASGGTTLNQVHLQTLNARMQQRASISFVLLTLTLPIIGGICASAGWSRLQNARAYGSQRRGLQRARRLEQDALERVHLAAGVVRVADVKVNAVRERSVDMIVRAAQAVYEDGFTRGFLVPETLHDGRLLHERLEAAVGHWLAVAQRGNRKSSPIRPEEPR